MIQWAITPQAAPAGLEIVPGGLARHRIPGMSLPPIFFAAKATPRRDGSSAWSAMHGMTLTSGAESVGDADVTRRRADSRLTQSVRDDRRGHWPAGVRRNVPSEDIMDVLTTLHTIYSARQMAKIIGVHDRTVRRWLAGDDVPSITHQRIIFRVAKEKLSSKAKPKR